MSKSVKVVVALLLFFVTFAAGTQFASADTLSNISPNPDDMHTTGDSADNAKTKHLLVKSDHGSVTSVKLAAYYGRAFYDAKSGGFTVGIYDGDSNNSGGQAMDGGGVCNAYATSSHHSSEDWVNVVFGSGSNAVTYTIVGTKLCTDNGTNVLSRASYAGHAVGSGTYKSNKFYGTYEIPRSALISPASTSNGTGWYKLPISISYASGVPTDPGDDHDQNQNVSFRVKAASNDNVGSYSTNPAASYIGDSNGGLIGNIKAPDNSTGANNSIVGIKKGDDGRLTTAVNFGNECGSKGTYQIAIHDADNYSTQAQNGVPLYFYVTEISPTGVRRTFTSSDYTNTGGDAAYSDTVGGKFVLYPSKNPDKRGNHVFVGVTLKPDYKYQLVVTGLYTQGNVFGNNYIYVGLPGDAITGDPHFKCNWNATPSSYAQTGSSSATYASIQSSAPKITAATVPDVAADRTVYFVHNVLVRGTEDADDLDYNRQWLYSNAPAPTDWSAATTSSTGTADFPLDQTTAINGISGQATKHASAELLNNVGKYLCERVKINPGTSNTTTPLYSMPVCVHIVAIQVPTCTIVPSGGSNDFEAGDSTNLQAIIKFFDQSSAPSGTIAMKNITGGASAVLPVGATTITNEDGDYTVSAATTSPFTLTDPKTYTIQATFSGNPTSVTCNQNFRAAVHPYLKVYGGDVEAGSGPSAYNSCSATEEDPGKVESWNADAAPYSGAGSQFGIQALDIIKGFVSAQNNTGSNPSPGYGLSFANDPTPSGVGNYGGKFGDAGACQDYSPATAAPVLTSYAVSADLLISAGQHPVVYVRGDAYINGNIIYTNSSSYTLDTIPSYRLVVLGGNIYIDHSVKELAGVFIAQPDANDKKGNIYTCATISGTVKSAKPDAGTGPGITAAGNVIPNYFDTCNNQLTVYGSFVAKHVSFLRTFGRLKQASADAINGATPNTKAAEQFVYGPEEWLGQTGNGSSTKPDSIISLPPAVSVQ